ncbi:uncharacterized protein LOC131951189 [Physella acuta]|uniref:uncharacterized protein LOC131951189 n=1 Tax=Physella acuta TaxID=109671 RepID=UPI0027DBB856|nr:uncharacterized protein LOC131951189 [Physella acuta]
MSENSNIPSNNFNTLNERDGNSDAQELHYSDHSHSRIKYLGAFSRRNAEDCAEDEVNTSESDSLEEPTGSDGGGGTFGEEFDVPYDEGWAWMISLSCFILFFVYFAYEQLISVLLLEISETLDTTVPVISATFSVGSFLYCVATQLSANFFLLHFSNRCVETCAAVLNVGASLFFVVSQNLTSFLIAHFIKSIAKGLTLIATITLIGFYFKRRRALAIAFGLTGGSLGIVAVPPLVRYLRENYGFRGSFLLIAGLEMHGILATLLLRPLSSYRKKKIVISEQSTPQEKQILLPLSCQDTENSENTQQTENSIKTQDSSILLECEQITHIKTADQIFKKKLYSHPVLTCPSVILPPDCKGDYEMKIIDQPKDSALQPLTPSVIETKFDRPGYISEVPKIQPQTYVDSKHIEVSECSDMLKTDVAPFEIEKEKLGCRPNESGNSNTNYDSCVMKTEVNETSHNSSTVISISENKNVVCTEEVLNVKEIYTPPPIHASLSPKHNDSILEPRVELTLYKISPQTDNTKAKQEVISEEHTFDNLNTENKRVFLSSENSNLQIRSHNSCLVKKWNSQNNSNKIKISNRELVELPIKRLPHGTWSSRASSLADDQTTETELQKSHKKYSCSWLRIIIDVSIIKNYLCILLFIIYICCNACILSIMYIPSLAIQAGVTPQKAAYLLTIVGAADMFGRISSEFELLIFFAAMQGFFSSINSNLDSILIVDVMGIKHLAKVLAMCSFCLSISLTIQHPIQGALIAYTGNFVATFQYVGVLNIIGSGLLLSVPLARRLQTAREERQRLKKAAQTDTSTST